MTDTTEANLSAGLVLKDRYRIVRLIGAGGMGAVYEARDLLLDKRVALKILHPSGASDGQLHARFLREAQAASALDHPHVVKSLDFGAHDGAPFLVMEFLEGESFADLLAREGPLSPVRALSLLEPVARAIERAHREGIIHRDIKPDNVFLARGDGPEACIPKLVDFGIAKRTQVEELRLTRTSVAIGTPFYMPPEQAMGAKDVTAAADQYAFSVMLYESVANDFPHGGDSYNELIVNKVTRDPRPLNEIQPELPAAFHDAIMRALAREPSQRYPSMDAFRQALLASVGQALPPPTNARSGVAGIAGARSAEFDDTIQRGHASATDTRKRSMTSVRGVEKSVHNAPTPRPGRSRARWIGIALGALALLGLTGLGGSRLLLGADADSTSVRVTHLPNGRTEYAIVRERDLPDAAVPTAQPSPSAVRTVRIRVTPASATITADGELVGTGAATLEVPSGHRLALGLRAPGYTPRSEDLLVDTDQSLERVLQRAPAPTRPPATVTTSAPQAPAITSVTPSIVRPAPSTESAHERAVRRHDARRLRRTGVLLDQSLSDN